MEKNSMIFIIPLGDNTNRYGINILVVVVGGVENVENFWTSIPTLIASRSFPQWVCWKIVEKLKTFLNVETVERMLKKMWKTFNFSTNFQQVFNSFHTLWKNGLLKDVEMLKVVWKVLICVDSLYTHFNILCWKPVEKWFCTIKIV